MNPSSIIDFASKTSPWLMQPPAFEGGDMVYKFYSLAKNKVLSYNKRGGKEESEEELPADDAKVVGSSHGWLALFNERNCDLFLSNPLTRQHIKLPSIHTLPIPEEYLREGYARVSKVILSCSPDVDEEECRAMMSFGPNDKPACCWPGRSAKWTPLFPCSQKARSYADHVYSNSWKLFFCMTENYRKLEAWNLQDPLSPRMIRVDVSRWDDPPIWEDEEGENYPCDKLDYCSPLTSLVVADQEIYHVTRYIMDQIAPDGSPAYDMHLDRFPYKTVFFDVHKYIPEERVSRLLMSSLDGLAFFIGHNHGFSLSAKEFAELKPNAIYFTDVVEPIPLENLSYLPYGGHDLGIFDYGKKTFLSCYYPCDVQSIKRIQPAPLWFTPTGHNNEEFHFLDA